MSIRTQAIEEAACLEPPEGIILLMEAFADPLWPLRKKSADLLIEMGASIIPVMMDVLAETENQDINYWSVRVLEHFEIESLDALKQLSKSEDREIRYFVAKALSSIDHDGIIPVLTSMLSDEDWVIRQEAAVGLENRGDAAIQYLRVVFATGSKDVKYWIIKIMGRVLKEEAVKILEKAIKIDDPDMRYHTVIALGETENEAAVPLLISALGDSSWMVRRQAAESIERLGKKAVKPLMKAFNTGDADLKFWVIKLYGRIMGGKGVSSLKKILNSSSEKETRYYVISSLGEIKDIEAGRALAECLSDKNWTIRKHAADCLLGMGDIALEAIDEASRTDQGADFYFWCSRVLERFGDRAIYLLVRVLKHEDKTVRIQAAKALADKEGEEVDRALIRSLTDKEWPVRKEISDILIDRGESVVPALVIEMSSGNDDIVFWGGKVLEGLGPKSVRPLVQVLADETAGKDFLQRAESLYDPLLTEFLIKFLVSNAEGELARQIHTLLERSRGKAREVWTGLEAESRKIISEKLATRTTILRTAENTEDQRKPGDKELATTISIVDDKVKDPKEYLLGHDVPTIIKLSSHKLLPLLGQALNIRYGIIHSLLSDFSLEVVVTVTREWLSLDEAEQQKIKEKETWLKNHMRATSKRLET